jgi:hypothetical protein
MASSAEVSTTTMPAAATEVTAATMIPAVPAVSATPTESATKGVAAPVESGPMPTILVPTVISSAEDELSLLNFTGKGH